MEPTSKTDLPLPRPLSDPLLRYRWLLLYSLPLLWVAWLAVAVGMLLPDVAKVREAAKRVQAHNNLKQLAEAADAVRHSDDFAIAPRQNDYQQFGTGLDPSLYPGVTTGEQSRNNFGQYPPATEDRVYPNDAVRSQIPKSLKMYVSPSDPGLPLEYAAGSQNQDQTDPPATWNLRGTAESAAFAALFTTLICSFCLLPRQATNAIYLRSFRNDATTGGLRTSAQAALGPAFRLSGNRQLTPDELRKELKDYVHEKLTIGLNKTEIEQLNQGFIQGFVDGFMDYVRMIREFLGAKDDLLLSVPYLSVITGGSTGNLGPSVETGAALRALFGGPTVAEQRQTARDRTMERLDAISSTIQEFSPENIEKHIKAIGQLASDVLAVYETFSKTGTLRKFFSSTLSTVTLDFNGMEADLHFVIDKMPPSALQLAMTAKANGPYTIGYVGGSIAYQFLEYAVVSALTAGIGAVMVAAKNELLLIRVANFLEKTGTMKNLPHIVSLAEKIAPPGWVSKLKFTKYIDEVKSFSSVPLKEEQINALFKHISTNKHEYLGSKATKARRAAFWTDAEKTRLPNLSLGTSDEPLKQPFPHLGIP